MPNSHRYALIMAGGRGTRFWPRSRKRNAKQVLRFFGDQSLIQQTVNRSEARCPAGKYLGYHKRVSSAGNPETTAGRAEAQIIAEPAQRNTAPCIGLAAKILADLDPDAVMGVFPADHLIGKESRFPQLCQSGLQSGRNAGCRSSRYPAAMAGNRIRLHRISGKHPGRGHDAASREEFSRKAGRSNSTEVFGCGPLLLECRHVLLEDGSRAQPAPASLAEDGDAARRTAAGAKLASLRRNSPRFIPAARTSLSTTASWRRPKQSWGWQLDDIAWNDVGSWEAVYTLGAQRYGSECSRGDLVTGKQQRQLCRREQNGCSCRGG